MHLINTAIGGGSFQDLLMPNDTLFSDGGEKLKARPFQGIGVGRAQDFLSYKALVNRYLIWKTGRSDLTRYELRQLRKPITSVLLMTIGLVGSVGIIVLFMLARG